MNAEQLHKDMIIWDAHRDVEYEAPLEERFLQGWMVGVDMHLPLLKKGGINVQVYAICVVTKLGLPLIAQVLKDLDRVMTIIEEHPDEIMLAKTTKDIRKANDEGKIAALLNIEGAEPILTELGLLRMLYRLGFRSIGLTWNYRNELGDGLYEGERAGGLSKFGIAVVEEMNRLGMVVDVAHLARNGVFDALRISEKPVVLSHGTVKAINPEFYRGSDDEVLEKIAENKGVFCVTTIPDALARDPKEASIEDLIDHIDHAVRIMGVEHVGLGADFDVYQSHLNLPLERWLKDLEEVDKWPNVTKALIRRGYPEADVRKIMGENLQRVYSQVID